MKQLAALLGFGVLAVAGGQAGPLQTTRDAPIPHASGQSVTPAYEGWFTGGVLPLVTSCSAAPVLPAGTVIHLTAWHDNTESNPANPDPTQWVGWGQRSYDDMYHAHVNITYLTDEDYETIIDDRERAALATGGQ